MERSYNGWTASPRPADIGIVPLVVAGESFSPGVRGGDVADVLRYVAEQLNARVEPVYKPGWHEADDWGYSYRPNTNNPSQLSCHASGTAIDYNATRHPNGRGGTWTPAQRAEINKILAEVNGCVVNLVGYDEMHFEISGNAAAVAAAAARVRRRDAGAATPATPSKPSLIEEEEFMYIKCDLDGKGMIGTAILSGSIFAGLSGGSVASVDENIKKGALVTWVSPDEWADLDRKSHALHDNPRPVRIVADDTRAA